MIYKTQPVNKVGGELLLPGDKSISHRSVMFASMAEGKSTIKNCLRSEDLISTINCFKALGVEIDSSKEIIEINGKGKDGLKASLNNLDCGNSGTTSRLISGILAAQKFESTLVGDDSLSKRPMRRIVDPLTQMGAKIITTPNGTLPITITPSLELHPIEFKMPVASAQVKSAVLLAGLYMNEKTCVIEYERTRNHTELMLGLEVEEFNEHRKIYSSRDNYPKRGEYIVPSDISSASFFIILTLLLPNSELLIKNISLNPTRTGLLNLLRDMGGDIQILENNNEVGEPFGDLLVKSSQLRNIDIPKEQIANIIDEIPILSVAGLFAEGEFEITKADELRQKESDRISALCENYKKLGVSVEEYNDGFKLSGNVSNYINILESFGDHRIAMTFGILGAVLDKSIAINNFECLAISNPEFENQLNSIVS
jgi:3-phosphoshikimate 1-carboxyvinyltransferase